MDSDVAPLAGMRGVGKSFGGVRALHDVAFSVRAGEVHALLGENGAGKSTLMKVLSGEVAADHGEITIDGEPVRFSGPADAQRAGIAMIHQELDLVPALSVAENVFLGREPKTRFGTLDRRRMRRETAALLARAGVEFDPRRPVGELRTGEQQLVVIVKALALDARILIMDEPTSALSAPEVERLFGVIAELRRAGAGIVYISHRMAEIGRIADRATVLRNGEVVAEFAARELTAAQASEAMVGRPVHLMFRTADGSASQQGRELLRVEDLAVRSRRPRPGRRDPAGVSLTVAEGEIVGLAGLLGSGRTELLETLYGIGTKGAWSGRVLLRGKQIRPRGARRALRAGIAFVPEDRRVAGLALEHSVLANTVLSIVDRIARLGWVPRRAERRAARASTDRLGVKLASLQAPVGALSGGNQQKVVLGRNLLTEPSLLLLDEPTRGVDVGAKAEIYRLLGDAAERGLGVLLASSEPAELIGVCDRVVVLHDGRSVRELDTAAVAEADLLAASMGEAALEEPLGAPEHAAGGAG
ncbi:sugar ABC transporter ATP-binding protein [Amycolatopsis acidicola]|uniref:Sugar ABC transporter ATP-binding protein n=1 Tax=Amycolatopsis acidicola TaxID=2596893 RepID=A0A5N0UZC4_9PSEU|nr:sugar ABC transporter ATP-binding protein [Amycolatopsis acidicola]KAA9157174.1 sugar ABC transporter ATP-binding protein [Amycolatopsis acidicola]